MNCTICGQLLAGGLDTFGETQQPMCFGCYWSLCEDRPSEIKASLLEQCDFGELQRQEWDRLEKPEPVEAWEIFDGDTCPHCASTHTIRIDVISHCPDIWHCECVNCEQGFEVIGSPGCEEDSEN